MDSLARVLQAKHSRQWQKLKDGLPMNAALVTSTSGRIILIQKQKRIIRLSLCMYVFQTIVKPLGSRVQIAPRTFTSTLLQATDVIMNIMEQTRLYLPCGQCAMEAWVK